MAQRWSGRSAMTGRSSFTRAAIILLAALLPGCSDAKWLPLPDGTVSRVAFGSCAMQWVEQPVWDVVVAAEPDLFLFIGDAIYGDWDGESVIPATAESLEREWERLGAQPAFGRLRDNVPVMATWDNHDYGKNDGNASFELKDTSRELFLDFFGEPRDSERRSHRGVYDAKIFGPPGRRVQVILLDVKYFKGPFIRDERSREEKRALGIIGNYIPNIDPDATLLGDEQWRWLEEQLRIPATVRLLVSSTQVIADEKGMDEWGNYPHERERLFDLIKDTGAAGVVFLSGNVHFGEISRIDTGSYPLLDFTSSGLTHANASYSRALNSRRIEGPYTSINFGLVEIDWGTEPATKITLALIANDGSRAFTHEVYLNALQPR